MKELQLSFMYALSNVALPVKRLSFALSTGDTPYLSIASKCLKKCKDTHEVLEFCGEPKQTKELMSEVLEDLKRLKALCIHSFDIQR